MPDTRAPVLECGDLSPLFVRAGLPAPAGDAPSCQPVPGTLTQQAAQSESCRELPRSKDWPHAPVHRFDEGGLFMVTAGTWHKELIFRDAERLDLLERSLLALASKYRWQLEAWAVFPNHYHFVARRFPDSAPLNKVCRHLHGDTARAVNRLEGTEGRQVWFQFWDSVITFQTSYLARLNYVHQNAVKHGLVPVANQWRWCSAAWFERTSPAATVKTIYGFKTDRLEVIDDF
jgi:putative transposase